jgi:hypothetical protein
VDVEPGPRRPQCGRRAAGEQDGGDAAVPHLVELEFAAGEVAVRERLLGAARIAGALDPDAGKRGESLR